MEATSRKLPLGFMYAHSPFLLRDLRTMQLNGEWWFLPFLQVAKGGLGLTKAEGALLQSWLVAFTYITPLIGGWIADKWVSPRILVPVGELLMGAGYFVAWQATSKTSLILCIALVAIGTGFF